MRLRDFQQILGKFTLNEKGTILSDCPIYIETQDGHLEAVMQPERSGCMFTGDHQCSVRSA